MRLLALRYRPGKGTREEKRQKGSQDYRKQYTGSRKQHRRHVHKKICMKHYEISVPAGAAGNEKVQKFLINLMEPFQKQKGI